MSKYIIIGRSFLSEIEKIAKPILEQDRKPKVKEIYKALVRDHPEMPAEKKIRIAERKAKSNPQARKSPEHGGPPYKGPITNSGGPHHPGGIDGSS